MGDVCYTTLLLCFSFKQSRLQKADEALADAEKALEQSSQPTYLAALAKGKALYLQGEFERSLIYVAQAEKMHPSAEARRLFFKSTEVRYLYWYQTPLYQVPCIDPGHPEYCGRTCAAI